MTKIKREETKISVITSRKVKKGGVKLNLRIFNKLVIALIIASGVYYVTGINDLTVKGFELSDLKKHARELNNENNSLEVKITAIDSYNGLDGKVRELEMVAVGNINYIENKADMVAKK